MCTQNIQFKGDLIFIGMDLNDLMERYDFQVYFTELNIHEAILTTHRRTSKLVIHIFTLENYSIDELWCSISIYQPKSDSQNF